MKKLSRLKSLRMLCGIGITVAVLTGCATIPEPTQQMAASQAAINNASKAGADEFAPQPLKSALDKMSAAEQALAAQDYARAEQLAEQVQVDAQLAAITARSTRIQKTARELQKDICVLQQQVEHNAQ